MLNIYLMRFQNHISHFHWFHTNLLESRNTLLISPRSHIKIIGKGEKKIRFFPCVQVNMYYCRVDGALKCNLSIPIILCWGWVLASATGHTFFHGPFRGRKIGHQWPKANNTCNTMNNHFMSQILIGWKDASGWLLSLMCICICVVWTIDI